MNAPDLTQRPPRSARVRLGGFVMLPRLLDKGRALLVGKNGAYHYNCPLDQRFFEFAGIDHEALKAELATGKGDGEILDWVTAHSTTKPTQPDIIAWSAWQEQRTPSDIDGRQYFNDLHAQAAPKREDIHTWFDLLDVDDFGSYGGQV
jgi:hypothetical protein